MQKQEYSSANTSINSNRLPKIYKMLDWEILAKHKRLGLFNNGSGNIVILDFGCGKYTDHIEEYCKAHGADYYWFDPNRNPKTNYNEPITPDIIICSNVLNVIKEDSIIDAIRRDLVQFGAPYFITVYEGRKDSIGRATKKDCWQRNEPARNYCSRHEIVYKGVITRESNKKFLL